QIKAKLVRPPRLRLRRELLSLPQKFLKPAPDLRNRLLVAGECDHQAGPVGLVDSLKARGADGTKQLLVYTHHRMVRAEMEFGAQDLFHARLAGSAQADEAQLRELAKDARKTLRRDSEIRAKAPGLFANLGNRERDHGQKTERIK